MLTVTAVESVNSFVFTVAFYSLSFVYEWVKQPANIEMTKEQYLALCKKEAELLAQHEIDSWAQPVPIVI